MSHFLENVLSAIDEDLGPFAERAMRARLTTARVFTDKQIDIWGKVVKENDVKADSTGGADKKGPAGFFLCLYEIACHFKIYLAFVRQRSTKTGRSSIRGLRSSTDREPTFTWSLSLSAFDDKAELQIFNLDALKRTLTIKNTHPLTYVSASARPGVRSLRL